MSSTVRLELEIGPFTPRIVKTTPDQESNVVLFISPKETPEPKTPVELAQDIGNRIDNIVTLAGRNMITVPHGVAEDEEYLFQHMNGTALVRKTNYYYMDLDTPYRSLDEMTAQITSPASADFQRNLFFGASVLQPTTDDSAKTPEAIAVQMNKILGEVEQLISPVPSNLPVELPGQ